MGKRKLWGIVLAVAMTAAVPAMGHAAPADASNIKAAYVNMQKVLQSDTSFRSAMEQVQQYRNKLRKKIQGQGKKLQKMQENLKEQGSILSKNQRKKKLQTLQRKKRALQQRVRKSQRMVQQKKQELLAPVLEKINPVLARVARQGGYDVVYSYGRDSNQSVLWVSDSVDITNQVIQRLKEKQ